MVLLALAGTHVMATSVRGPESPSSTSVAEAAAKRSPQKERRPSAGGATSSRSTRPPTVPSPAPSTSAPPPHPAASATGVPADEPAAAGSTTQSTALPAGNGSTAAPAGSSPQSPVLSAANGSAPASAAAGGAVAVGGLFPLLSPGSSLPSGEECAARVQRNAWEPQPENSTANATSPTGTAPYGMTTWYTAGADAPAYRGRVDGHFTAPPTTSSSGPRASGDSRPTSTELRQWLRAPGSSPSSATGESYGLYQMRRGVWGAYPNSSASTAFNADWAMGLRRACYDGVMWYAELRGDLEACIGVHFSGDPTESTWRAYTDAVLE